MTKEPAMLGCVKVYQNGVSDLTLSLELADCNISVEFGTLEAGVAACSIG